MTGLRTFARVDGHLLRVTVAGEGHLILLIMGLGGNIEMWAPLARELHHRGYQTIAYDASGTGHSPPRLVPLRPHGLARQAVHLLDQLGLPQADVIGVSSEVGWRRSSPCGTRTGCGAWSSPRRPAVSAACPAHQSRSDFSPRRCGTTRLASCRRPRTGCTGR
jgi:hypothetical protein